MVDRNRDDFQGRIGRIERIHDKGGGFEADGTLGMTYYNARRRRARLPRWPLTLLVVLVVLLLLKAGLHVAIGGGAYDHRVAALRQGSKVEQIGAWLLQADPATLALAERMRRLLD
jgi:hypothetical protein